MPRHCERDEFPEIEITPEMIEMGKRAIAGYNPDMDYEDDVVSRVYREMVKAKILGAVADTLFDWRVQKLEAALKCVEKREHNVV